MALGMLCTNVILKQLVLRPRPYVTMEALIPLLTSADPNSFPSGHTCAAFAAGMAWAGALPWRWARAAAVVQAVCMGLSRLYVGVHYPSDVLAGALIGRSVRALRPVAGRPEPGPEASLTPQFSRQKSRPAAVFKTAAGRFFSALRPPERSERRPVPPARRSAGPGPPRKGERRHPPGPDSGRG